MVSDEKQRKIELKLTLRITRCFLKTNKSWIEYSAFHKIWLSLTLMGHAIQTVPFFRKITVTILGLPNIRIFMGGYKHVTVE